MFFITFAALFLSNPASACTLRLFELKTRLVQTQNDEDAGKIKNFGEIELIGSLSGCPQTFTLTYQATLDEEGSARRASVYHPKTGSFLLSLSQKFSTLFESLKKNTGTEGLLSALSVIAERNQGVERFSIDTNDTVVHKTEFETRTKHLSVYPAALLKKLFLLGRLHKSATTEAERKRIVLNAYSIIFQYPKSNLGILLSKSGLSRNQAIRAAMAASNDEFPRLWSCGRYDYVLSNVVLGAQKLQFRTKAPQHILYNLAWDFTKIKTEVRHTYGKTDLYSFTSISP